MNKKYKCVIFDLDGTVLNTERQNIIPLQRVIKEELNLDIEYKDLLKYMAYPGMKTMELLGFENKEETYKKWVKYVNEFEEEAILYDGFDIVLDKLHNSGVVCAIASSKLKAQYEIDFTPKDLDKYVQAVVLADDTENHKPHPEPLLKVAEMLKIEAKDCLYVGDTIADYKASNNAGMDFALAIWGANDIKEIEATYNLNKPMDILELFKLKV